jgi:ABC-type phosphate/phosphonate transport system substrate-binding protein
VSGETIIVGAVAYHPRIVTIWERFREYFTDVGVATDYLLYSNYERLVAALLEGDVDIAWNTNTAYVAAEQQIDGDARLLGMRDVDADYRTVLVTRRDAVFEQLEAIRGRRVAIGSRDSGHAAILPLHYLQEARLGDAEMDLIRFDTDLGKHGDTGDSEIRVVEAVSDGRADVGALGDATWVALRTQGHPAVGDLNVAWRSPTYFHCNFTALPSLDGSIAAAWSEALLAMSYDDASLRPAMDLEGVRRWLPADTTGYETLTIAMREQGYIQ